MPSPEICLKMSLELWKFDIFGWKFSPCSGSSIFSLRRDNGQEGQAAALTREPCGETIIKIMTRRLFFYLPPLLLLPLLLVCRGQRWRGSIGDWKENKLWERESAMAKTMTFLSPPAPLLSAPGMQRVRGGTLDEVADFERLRSF